MKIGITGEQGFIAVNLKDKIQEYGHTFVSLDNSEHSVNMHKNNKGEICVHRNSVESWIDLFDNLELDIIVHNAATVGTDVVALNMSEAINTNILGTKNITEAANISGLLNVYIGTTVIYDTFQYQESSILEDSAIYPRTDYAIQKYAGEMIVRNFAKEWLVIRPLFAFGGVGDMNSLIAKSLFAVKNNKENVDMFLDPKTIKDYMHVEDFCNAIMMLVNENKIRNEDFNISAENPHTTSDIVSLIEEESNSSLEKVLKWYPENDYLGNHRLSCNKFKNIFPNYTFKTLKEGIRSSKESIFNSKDDYNPLKFLEEAKSKNLNLTEFFPPKP